MQTIILGSALLKKNAQVILLWSGSISATLSSPVYVPPRECLRVGAGALEQRLVIEPTLRLARIQKIKVNYK